MREASGQEQVYDSGMGNAAHEFAPDAAAKRVEEMYTAHARLVRSVCRSLLRDRSDAEDATQQTFLSAQRALANGSTPREPAAWLATIARNECLARVRERMREPLPVEAEPAELGADTHSVAVSNFEMATLREALADLPRLQREAILLRELRGMSYDEVARALSVTTAAVESLIFRARRTLQGKLREALPAFSPLALLARVFGAGGGEIAAPAVVAKVAAIGVGAAVLAGGAAFGTGALHLRRGAAKTTHPSPPHTTTPRSVEPAPAHIWSPQPASQPTATTEQEHPAASGETASSDVTETTPPETSASDDATTEPDTEPTATTPVVSPPPTPSGSGEPSTTVESDDTSDDPPGTDN